MTRLALRHRQFHTVTVDISLLLKSSDSNESESSSPPTQRPHTRSSSIPSSAGQPEFSSYAHVNPPGVGGKRNMPPHPGESPAKKQSKWSADEDALIIDLRGRGMKWEDISKRLPGRSAISCRLHYQNYLERRSEWDEEKKNKLARLYERFKPEMWSKVAEEMQIPWRAAEAMHWQLGEADMARRAGVVPFSLSNVTIDSPSSSGPSVSHSQHRSSPSRSHSRGHSQSHSQSSMGTSTPRGHYSRPPSAHSHSHSHSHSQAHSHPPPISTTMASSSRSIAARRESTPRSVPPVSPSEGIALAAIGSGRGMPGPGQYLPSVAEMTTGVSPYNTPAYAMGMSSGGGGYVSPGPTLPSLGMGAMMGHEQASGRSEGKRRHSPEGRQRDTRRRH